MHIWPTYLLDICAFDHSKCRYVHLVILHMQMCIWSYYTCRHVHLVILHMQMCASGHITHVDVCIWSYYTCRYVHLIIFHYMTLLYSYSYADMCIWSCYTCRYVHLVMLHMQICASGHVTHADMCIWSCYTCRYVHLFIYLQICVSGHIASTHNSSCLASKELNIKQSLPYFMLCDLCVYFQQHAVFKKYIQYIPLTFPSDQRSIIPLSKSLKFN